MTIQRWLHSAQRLRGDPPHPCRIPPDLEGWIVPFDLHAVLDGAIAVRFSNLDDTATAKRSGVLYDVSWENVGAADRFQRHFFRVLKQHTCHFNPARNHA